MHVLILFERQYIILLVLIATWYQIRGLNSNPTCIKKNPINSWA